MQTPPPSPAPPLPAKLWAKRAGIFGFWTWLTFFFASRDYLSSRSFGMGTTLTKALWWKAMEWYAWAALSLIIFWICRKFYNPARPWWRYIAIHLFAGTVLSTVHVGICSIGAWLEAQVIQTGYSWAYLFKLVFLNHFHFDWLVYAGIVSIWHAVDYYRRFRDHEVQAAALETRLARAQLQTLKTQLQPHFLFNTLHSISALNHEDPKAANRMLARLSSLLRLTLDKESVQEVTLKEELEFLQYYLDIEQVRLGDRLNVTTDIAPDTLDAIVPNLLLQPIVENAIRYGISPYASPGRLSICAQTKGNTLCLQITDTGPGLPGKPLTPGVGLGNTRERLQQLYGHESHLDLANGETGGLTVTVSLPFRSCVPSKQAAASQFEHENTHAHR